MREIEFRGKNKKGIWFHGSYIETNIDAPAIVWGDGEQMEVVRETVGQFTGIKQNDSKIFEGDRLSFTVFDCFDNDTQYMGVVEYIGSRFMIVNPNDKDGNYGNDGPFDLDWVCYQDDELEIIKE